jgi:hypothetical protein
VAVAATCNIEQLSLDGSTRLRVHAPELEGLYPCLPLGINDEDIPDDPPSLLGSELSLASLL